jgi:hypothetical protein
LRRTHGKQDAANGDARHIIPIIRDDPYFTQRIIRHIDIIAHEAPGESRIKIA